MLAAALGLLIVSGYVLSLWWLLRREGPWAFVGLAALCGLSLALRVVLTTDYPAGLNEDEPKNLACSMEAVGRGAFFEESCNGPPYLLSVLFAVPLVPYLGFGRWAMRGYSLVTGVLATPVAYAVARGMGLRVGASLVGAGLIAVLPWSIFYGRISLGGELIFHELLLLAGLTRLVWMAGRWPDALISALGLCLLLWDYLVGKSMVGLPLVAAVLARGVRRVWCLAVVPLALLGWYQHLRTGPRMGGVGFSAASFNPGMSGALWQTLIQRTEAALSTFVWPVAQDSLFTMRAVAVHPVFLLAIAGLGLLTGVRRGLFLLAGFAAGLLPGIVATLVPGVVSGGVEISTHRTMMAFPFIALAAASALDVLPWRALRGTVATAVLLAVGVWSVEYYFSPRFWGYGEHHFSFDVERTALNETVVANPPPRLIPMWQIGYYVPRVEGMPLEFLDVDNWMPRNQEAVTYLFTWHAAALRPQYERMFPGRVQPVAQRSFLVNLEAGDWSWLRRYGWAYEVRCADLAHSTQVPFLYSMGLGVTALRCPGERHHVWRAHWHGPPTEMVLLFSGRAEIEIGGTTQEFAGWEQYPHFMLPADSDVTITVTLPGGDAWPYAALLEVSPAGDRVPTWDRFTPVWPGIMAAPASVPLPP